MIRFQITILCALLLSCAPARRFPDVRAQASAYRYVNTVDVGEVDEENMVRAYRQVRALARGGAKTVTLRIDSPGGSVFLGLKWIQMVTDLKKTRGFRVNCVVDGGAYSMAAVILESPVCDARFATPGSTLLFHNAQGGGRGTAEEVRSALAMIEALNQALGALVADRMRIPYSLYRAHVDRGDWVLAVPDALLYGALDAQISSAEIAPPGDA